MIAALMSEDLIRANWDNTFRSIHTVKLCMQFVPFMRREQGRRSGENLYACACLYLCCQRTIPVEGGHIASIPHQHLNEGDMNYIHHIQVKHADKYLEDASGGRTQLTVA